MSGSPSVPAGDGPPAAGDSLAARRSRSFGGVAAGYHGARATYSQPSVSWALEPAGPGALRILDLAAGTGLLTAALLAHHPTPDLVAVEPDEAMRAEYVRHEPGVPVRAGTAETIPAPDGALDSGFDAVVVGTAFHWFDQVRALPEIARVLRDGGVLAALWTAPDETVEWVRDYREASRAALSTSRTEPARGGPPEIGPHPLFGEFATGTFRHTEVRPLGELVGAVATYSEVITAPAAERAAAVRATELLLRARLDSIGPALSGRPDSIEVPVVVVALRAQRRPRT